MMQLNSDSAKNKELRYPFTVRVQQLIESSWRRTAQMYGHEEYDVNLPASAQFNRRYDIIAGAFSPSAQNNTAKIFRYEQIRCESPRADVEAIAIAKRSLDVMGVSRSSYRIRVNDYQILQLLLTEYLELDAIQAGLLARLLSQKRTMQPTEFRDKAIEIVDRNRAAEVLPKLSKLLAAKSAEDLPEIVRSSENYVDLVALYQRLELLEIEGVVLDITLSHPEYMTGIIFDITEVDGESATLLCKGGRYLNTDLNSAVGGQMDFVGVADVLARHAKPENLPSRTEVFIMTVGDVLDEAEKIAEKLRSERVSVEVDYTDRPLDKQLKEAIKKRIHFVMTIDEAAVKKGLYRLQNLRDSSESETSFERVVTAVSDRRRRDQDDDVFDLSDIL